MAEIKNAFAEQLKQTCKLSGARWGVWLNWTGKEWAFGLHVGLSKLRLSALTSFIQSVGAATWLAGALSSGRTRSRATAESADALDCQRVYLFANPQTQSAILVGADDLTKDGHAFLKVLALSNPFTETEIKQSQKAQALIRPFEMGLEPTYDPQAVLDQVVEMLASEVPCQASYVAIRAGDRFRVGSVWKYAPDVLNSEIPIGGDEFLENMVVDHQGTLLRGLEQPPALTISAALYFPVRSCVFLPIVIGRRVIGLAVFVSSRPAGLSKADMLRAESSVRRVSHIIENVLVFSEISRYLQQFALMNELASAASAGTDTGEVARRVVQRLRRVFELDLAAVLLLSPDGKTLRDYGHQKPYPRTHIPVETSLAGYVVETGLPVRLGDVRQAPRYLSKGQNVQSVLFVPLKYRAKIIGAIAVESAESNAFTSKDEQLLVLLASHLAGLFENVRLHQETRERASNLSLIHKVVQRVVGLTDVHEIVKVTAELVGEYFGYEFAVVLLVDETGQYLVNQGQGGTMSHLLEPGYRYPVTKGITGRVFQTGVSYFSNDLSNEPDYFTITGWQAGSELCVPLRDGGNVFGLINLERAPTHAFSKNDLLLLESLAGVISSVVTNARQYQKLQLTVSHLHAARDMALDIAGDLDLDTLFQRVIRRAMELTQAKGAALGLYNEIDQVVRIVCSENPWFEFEGAIIPWMTGVAGHVAALGEPLKISNYHTWPERLDPDDDSPVTTVAGVPLKWKGQVIGVLLVQDDEMERTFKDEEVRLLELLAPQVAVSIHNARLYQELEERIEAQRQTERRLVRSAKLAALGELAAGVAHEINNPLTTVTGFVELALDELSPDLPQRAELEVVLREARRARGVVRRMLDFARQSENVRLHTDLNDMVSEVLTLVQHLAQTGGVQIQVHLDDHLPAIIADPNQIKQVLLNLIQNALQAMPDGGSLELTTSFLSFEGQPGVALAVHDTGDGIPDEYLEKVFEPFFTTRQIGAGTGLGLSVSYGLVTDHGGHIDVTSQVGVGSCFTVWLPVES